MKVFFSIGATMAFVLLAAMATPPDTHAAQACPEGTIWDDGKKECVPFPRGSHDEN